MGARFEVSYEDISSVVDCSILKNKVEDMMVFLKLSDSFPFRDFEQARKKMFIWAWELEANGEVDDFDDLEDKLADVLIEKIEDLIKETYKISMDFQLKTGVTVYWDYDGDEDRSFFELKWDDILQYTPKANELYNMGVNYEMVTYED